MFETKEVWIARIAVFAQKGELGDLERELMQAQARFDAASDVLEELLGQLWELEEKDFAV